MTKTTYVLLAKRKDGLFLVLDKQQGTTTHSYTSDPALAYRVTPYVNRELIEPKDPSYYFEPTRRAEGWLKDCTMVGYEVVETTKVRVLN